MISNACTRTDIGASAGSEPASAHPSLICGVSDEVIQVSIMSGSPTRRAAPDVPDAPDAPHDGQAGTGGASVSGSTGRSASRASTGVSHAAQNQTGNGTP